jgi:hypothetical protein
MLVHNLITDVRTGRDAVTCTTAWNTAHPVLRMAATTHSWPATIPACNPAAYPSPARPRPAHRCRRSPPRPGAQERGDGGRGARSGEMQQRRLGGRVDSRLLVLAVAPVPAFAVGGDDLPVLVVPDVDLAFSAGQRVEASCSTSRSSCECTPWSTATRGRNEAEAIMFGGSSPGSRRTGTVIRAT